MDLEAWRRRDVGLLSRAYQTADASVAALVERQGGRWRWHAWDLSGEAHRTGTVPDDRAGGLGGTSAAILAADAALAELHRRRA